MITGCRAMPDNHVNARGNSRDRAARRKWLLRTFGNGVSAPCWECGAPVTDSTIVVDRIKPGKQGGRYVRGNIRPQCRPCSNYQGYVTGVGIKHRAMVAA